MDSSVVICDDGHLAVVENRNLKKGDKVILGRSEKAEEGIYMHCNGFTAEGALVPPQAAGEDRVLETARLQRVVPVFVLTPLDAEGHFNNNLVTALVRDLDVQQRVIRGIWEQVQKKGYGIVDVDFEYVLAEDRELLVDFVRRLRVIMNLYGVRVTVALAPKTSRGQKGLLYEGIDYRALGEAADGVLLMTYEWGYTYEQTTMR